MPRRVRGRGGVSWGRGGKLGGRGVGGGGVGEWAGGRGGACGMKGGRGGGSGNEWRGWGGLGNEGGGGGGGVEGREGAQVGDLGRGEDGPRLTKSRGLGGDGRGRGLCYVWRGDQKWARRAGIAVERTASQIRLRYQKRRSERTKNLYDCQKKTI